MCSDFSNLPKSLQDQIQSELKPGELLVWAARPLPRLFRRQAAGHVVGGIVWLVFIAGMLAVPIWLVPRHELLNPGEIIPLVLIGGLFSLVECLFLCSPFQVGRRTSITVYALTDRRAIVFNTGDSIGNVTLNIQSFGRDVLATLVWRRSASVRIRRSSVASQR